MIEVKRRRRKADPNAHPKVRSKSKPEKQRAELTVREAAVKDYVAWMRGQRRIDHIIHDTLNDCRWDERDRSLFHEIVNGVVRHHGRIEWMLTELSSKGINRDIFAQASAAIGIYQILYLDRVPNYASVDAAVEIARNKVGEAASKWVNAILRRVTSDVPHWQEYVPKSDNSRIKLAMLHSFPVWMVERWGAQFRAAIDKTDEEEGIDPNLALEQFLIWNNRRPIVTLRTNLRRITPKQLEGKLDKRDIGYRPSPLDPAFLDLEHSINPADLSIVRDGFASVQDASQGMVSKLLNPLPGESILDLCSAPGGKTGHLSELQPDCKIVATDNDASRLKRVVENAARCGYQNVTAMPYNELLSGSKQLFDAVLVDAPCTGTGVLAKRADIRWRRKLTDLNKMVAVQRQILRYAADRVKRGGRLIYSTCSIEPEENELMVESFLQEHSGFHAVTASDWIPEELTDQRGYLKLLGPEVKADGVFAVRLERR